MFLAQTNNDRTRLNFAGLADVWDARNLETSLEPRYCSPWPRAVWDASNLEASLDARRIYL